MKLTVVMKLEINTITINNNITVKIITLNNNIKKLKSHHSELTFLPSIFLEEKYLLFKIQIYIWFVN